MPNWRTIPQNKQKWWINQQKQREKILYERLQSVKQQIGFYTPVLIKQIEEIRQGEGSTEREVLQNKLNNVLACFYVQQSQIPGEPTFQIQNRAPCVSPKLISFNKQRINNKDLTNNSSIFKPTIEKIDRKDLKPIKGILKGFSEEKKTERSESEPRRIDPALILLLKDINNNKGLYTKEKTEMLLQPYKASGELQYLKNNPKILASLFKQPEQSYLHSSEPLRSSVSPGRMLDPYNTRYSISPQPEKQPTGYQYSQPTNEMSQPLNINPQYAQYAQYQNYQTYGAYGQYQNYNAHIPPQHQPQGQQYQQHLQNSQMQPFNPYQQQQQQQQSQPQQNHMQSNRNFKTLPCKYYHSPQGCVKASGCTFIHDEQYAGKPTPSMLKSNRGMVNNYGQEMREPGPNQQTYYHYSGYGDGRQQ